MRVEILYYNYDNRSWGDTNLKHSSHTKFTVTIINQIFKFIHRSKIIRFTVWYFPFNNPMNFIIITRFLLKFLEIEIYFKLSLLMMTNLKEHLEWSLSVWAIMVHTILTLHTVRFFFLDYYCSNLHSKQTNSHITKYIFWRILQV